MSFLVTKPQSSGVLVSSDMLDAYIISGMNSIFTTPRNLGSIQSPLKLLLGDSTVDEKRSGDEIMIWKHKVNSLRWLARLWAERSKSPGSIPVDAKIFLFFSVSRPNFGPLQPSFQWVWEFFLERTNLTTGLHQCARLSKCLQLGQDSQWAVLSTKIHRNARISFTTLSFCLSVCEYVCNI